MKVEVKMTNNIRLNCDLGESYGNWSMGNDHAIMPLIDMANIACGFHASDPLIMDNTVALAKKHQVMIGAHPAYPDLQGFGRRSLSMSKNELKACITYQVGALQAICTTHQSKVEYVKPHGALYNDMMKDLELFETVCQAVSSIDANMQLMVQSLPDMTPYLSIAKRHNLNLLMEVFADRNYQDSGLLVSRDQTNAVIHDKQIVVNRLSQLLTEGVLLSESGNQLSLKVDSLCVHGDNLAAVDLVTALAEELNARQ